jgi:hypothetical protein
MRNKLRSIESAARRLLAALGLLTTEDAPDGPEDWDVLDALAGALRRNEDLVIDATGDIGKLVELVVQAFNSASLLERAAAQATVEQARLGLLIVPLGHQGNVPLVRISDWVPARAGCRAIRLSSGRSIREVRPGCGEGWMHRPKKDERPATLCRPVSMRVRASASC